MEKEKTGIHLFVYGTLMSGFENHHFLYNQDFEPAILNEYIRICAFYPVILKKKNHKVIGEVYSDLPSKIFERIIWMENAYKPITVTVKTLEGKEVIATTFYPTDEYRLCQAEDKYKRFYQNEKTDL